METRLRPRRLTASTLTLLALVTPSCDRSQESPVEAGTDTRDASVVVDAILDRTQGARRGTFGRATLELREVRDGPATVVSFDLPDRMRVVDANGSWTLRVGDEVTTGTADEPSHAADDAHRATTATLCAAIATICLRPLERCARAERIDGDTLAITTRDGESFELDYDPALDATRRLRGPGVDVTIVEDLDRGGRARIPVLVDIAGVGRRYLRFVDTGIEFEERVFQSPDLGRPTAPEIVVGGPARDLRARIQRLDPVRWLMMPDPGDWAGRLELFHTAGGRLGPRGYGNGGDPFLVEDDAGAWFVVPFVPLRADAEDVPLDSEERITAATATRAVVADAPDGDWAERRREAQTAIDAFVADRKLTIGGPLRLAFNLIGRDPATDPACLQDLPLRLVQPLAAK